MKLKFEVEIELPAIRNEEKKEFVVEEIRLAIETGEGIPDTVYWDNPNNDKDEEEVEVIVFSVQPVEDD